VVEGLPAFDGNGREMSEVLAEAAGEAFESIPRPRRKDAAGVAETLRIGVRRAAHDVWGKKPVCRVIIHRL
jgi:ribonuclease J